MNKQIGILLVAAVAVAAAVLVWVGTRGPKAVTSACTVQRLYAVDLINRSRTEHSPTVERRIQMKLVFTPLVETDKRLYRVTAKDIVLTEYPPPFEKALSEASLYWQPQTGLLWKDAKSEALALNVFRIALSAMAIPSDLAMGTSQRPVVDPLGQVETEFGNAADTIHRKKLAYRSMHMSPILPKIVTSADRLMVDRGTVVALSTNSVLVYDWGQGPKTEVTELIDASLTSQPGLSQDLAKQCLIQTIESATKDLAVTSFALDSGVAQEQPAKTIDLKAVLKKLPTSSKDSMAEMREASLLIEKDPKQARTVVDAIKKATRNEELSAMYLSILAHARSPEAQAALREVMDFYRDGKHERLLIRTIRSQQLSDYIIRDNVEYLSDYSEDSRVPTRAKQAALLATGSTAATLGEPALRTKFHDKWEERFADAQGGLAKMEYLSAMGNLANTSSETFLKQVASADKSAVGNQAIDAMRLIRTPGTESFLIDTAVQSTDSERRRSALQALSFAPLSESTCNALIKRYNVLLTQFGTSMLAERVQILAALGKPEHRGVESVTTFLKDLGKDPRLTKQETEIQKQLVGTLGL